MGRRALRKIDPRLDLSRQLKTFEDLPSPWNAESLFGRRAPLEIDVGSGKGLFLMSSAAAHPERDFLGIEISRKYARFTAARLAKREMTNAVVVCGDALRLFEDVLNEGCAQAVHVYFPDPWWKKRHKKRRVMTEHFLHNVERALEPGGALHFWTDVKEYFDTSLDMIAQATRLMSFSTPDEQPADDNLDYRTHFERRMRIHDEVVFRAAFAKPAAAG
jgi:tRNA (guanine-N7-)-methyltransferase